jgi:hypothetical protein
MKQNTSHAVMAQRGEPRDSLDDFLTPPWATRATCEYLRATGLDLGSMSVWEPACGRGHMARPLAENFGTVHASDIHPYGYGAVYDFLKATAAIKRAKVLVALIVRNGFLESSGRYDRLFKPNAPSAVLQFTERVPMVKGRCDPKASTATSYAWVVWFPAIPAVVTTLEWIAPCRLRLERFEDYSDC